MGPRRASTALGGMGLSPCLRRIGSGTAGESSLSTPGSFRRARSASWQGGPQAPAAPHPPHPIDPPHDSPAEERQLAAEKEKKGKASELVEVAVCPVWAPRPVSLPGGSQGSSRPCWSQSAASAAVASAARAAPQPRVSIRPRSCPHGPRRTRRSAGGLPGAPPPSQSPPPRPPPRTPTTHAVTATSHTSGAPPAPPLPPLPLPPPPSRPP